jgi:hypothetical protein
LPVRTWPPGAPGSCQRRLGRGRRRAGEHTHRGSAFPAMQRIDLVDTAYGAARCTPRSEGPPLTEARSPGGGTAASRRRDRGREQDSSALCSPSRRACPGREHGDAKRCTQNTRSLRSRIHYPYHPLSGRELEVAVVPRDGRGPVTVWPPAGDRLKVPAWMLSAFSALVTLSERPSLSKTALMALVALVELAADERRPGSLRCLPRARPSSRSVRTNCWGVKRHLPLRCRGDRGARD